MVVYLACLVGGGRLLAFAHLAFSDHRHAFCAEHGRFEDVPAGRTSPDPVATHQGLTTVGGGALASAFAAHSACLFLNSRTVQAPIQLADQDPAVGLDSRALDPTCPRDDGIVASRLLLWAPKTSPPFVTV